MSPGRTWASRTRMLALAAAFLTPTACGTEGDGEPRGEAASGAADGGSVRVLRAFVVVPPGGGRGAVYAVIVNDGSDDDALLALRAPGLSPRVELHETVHREGLMVMEAVDSLPVPGGREVRMEPGGHHGMLLAPARAPEPVDTVSLRFRFRGSGEWEVRAPVVPYAELEARLEGRGPSDSGGG